MIYFTYLHFRRGEYKKLEFILWQILWLGFLIVVIFPTSMSFVLTTFSINSTFELVIIVAIVILFGLTFRNYVVVKRLDSKIEQIVRTQALNSKE